MEDSRKRGIELLFDTQGGILELATGLLERREDPAPFAGDLITRDRRGIGSRLEHFHHEPRRTHPDAGGDRGAREGRGVAAVRIVLGHGIRKVSAQSFFCHHPPANSTVDRYRSPESGSTVTIVLPANASSRASRSATAAAAPHEMPERMPSSLASRRAISTASSSDTVST